MSRAPSQAPGSNPPQALATALIARDPADLRHLLWFVAIACLAAVAELSARRTTAGVEADILRLLGAVPSAVIGLAVLGIQVLHLLLLLGVPVLLIATRQWRTLVIAAAGYCAAVLIVGLSLRAMAAGSAAPEPDDPPGIGASAPSLTAGAVGAAICTLVVLSPQLNRPWRRFGWGFIAALAAARALTSAETAGDMLLAVGIGGAIGSLLLIAFGRQVAVPSPLRVAVELEQLGFASPDVSPAEHNADGSLWFRAVAGDASFHCKVLTARGHQSDRMVRALRRLRVRELGEDAPYSTVRRAAAVEAMLAMSAASAGVATPAVRGIAALNDDDMIIVFDQIDGRPLDRVGPARITDEVLRQAWRTVAGLRRARLAHRDLQLSNWLLDDADRLWLIDFSFGEPAATTGAMRADIAELLSATYAVVGAKRAVGSAVEVLGPQTLREGLGHLVPAALSRPTRAAVKQVPQRLAPLVAATSTACRVSEPQFAPIERFKPRTLVMAGLLAVAVYVLLPQLADLPRMLQAVRAADPGLIAAAAAACLVMFLGVGLALKGSISAAVGFGSALLAGVAASFFGAVAPPSVARVGVNVRFAQKHGLDSPEAVSAAAAKELATVVVHVVLLLLVVVVAGSSGTLPGSFGEVLRDGRTALLVAVVLALLSVAIAVPKVRAFIGGTVLPAVRRSVGAMRALAADPVRMLALLGGASLLHLGYIGALLFSMRALGGDVGLITVALIYLTVGAAATIAPTPGGLGAVEAVLLAAFTGVGVEPAQALAGVFVYRLLTFWLPIPVGALAARWLTSRDLL